MIKTLKKNILIIIVLFLIEVCDIINKFRLKISE